MASELGVQTIQHTNGTNAMEIDSGGRITQPNQVRFIARGNDDSYINTTPVPFPTVEQNVGGGYNSSTHKFTAPVAGTYMFQANFGIVRLNVSNNYAYFSLRKNSSTTLFYSYLQVPTATAFLPASMNIMVELAVGDTIHMNFNYSGSATYYNDAAECWFSGYLLG